MSITNNVITPGDVARKEDVVLNMVEILTAEENQLLSMLGKTSAINTIHSYLTDTLRTPASAAVEEGEDYTLGARTTPSRLTNLVQEIAIPFAVSELQQSVQHYTGQNELDRQLSKAMMDWGNAAEFDIVRSTLVSGASGTVAKMSGIIEAISKSTNTTVQTSGTVFSASILDGLMENNWNNSNGDVVSDIFVGSTLRRVVDSFTQKTNVVVNAPGIVNIVKTVQTYETSMGTVTIHKHRYVQVSADATGRVLGLNKNKIKLAYLKKPYVQADLSKNGPYDKRAIYGSLTVEVSNQDSNLFASGYLKTA
jgi:hypothetical protein